LWKDKDRQPAYYQPGIGTDLRGSRNLAIRNKAFVSNIDEHIMGGYEFVLRECRLIGSIKSIFNLPFTDKKGDRICLFGFSRGAYIARALAGMLHAVGVPSNKNLNAQITTEAYKAYKKGLGNNYKGNFSSEEIGIKFVGVWDTVASVGASKILPFTESNPSIKTFRHALALDVRHIKFEPVHYDQANNTSAREVWFLGSHSNVGGGSVKTGTRSSLQRVALRWMVGECFDADTGILFKEDALRALLEDRTEDGIAAINPDSIKDELDAGTLKKMRWRGMEFIPTINADRDRRFKNFLRGPSLFRGRTIQGEKLECHTTVKARMDERALNYVPQAKWPGHSIRDDAVFVDSNDQQVRECLGYE